MINALEAAKISRKAPNDYEVYWKKIQRTIEVEITSAAKYGNIRITFHVNKHRAYIAGMLMNLDYRVVYNQLLKDSGDIDISWANKNIQAGNEIFDEEHTCECKHCKKEMK